VRDHLPPEHQEAIDARIGAAYTPGRCTGDMGKSIEKLGWEPTVSIEVGVQNTIDWYLKNRAFLNRLKD